MKTSTKRPAITLILILSQAILSLPAYAAGPVSERPISPFLHTFFSRFLPQLDPPQPVHRQFAPSLQGRRTLFNDDADAAPADSEYTDPELRTRIAAHELKLANLRQESKDLAHERAFLEKSIELKKGQRTMQDGQVKLSQAELEDKAKEIEMYKREAPRTLLRYNELVRKQKEMQDTLNRLHQETEELSTSKEVILDKIQHLNMEDLVEKHARALPDAMAGALRKSAAALIPFFDYLMIAADTNNRLVDHVGAEIDKYTHVNISSSPFMSGILFYCVLLIPLLTIISFVRRVFDSSSKLTVSHYIIFGNLYFVIMCVANVFAACVLKEDPMSVLYHRLERTFIISNLFLSLYYCWHVVMLGLQAIYTMEKRNISQFLATLSVGIHYFLFAWRRIFTDHAPMMYTCNYLVYGTIFCFILYERYNRMSSRQLNDSTIFRVTQLILKRRSNLSTFRGFKSVCRDVWMAIFTGSSPGHRGSSKRHERHPTSDHGKTKSEGREKGKAKGKGRSAHSSEEEDREVRDSHRRSGYSSSHYKKSKHKLKAKKEQESRGFISIFFGSREDGDDSSESEERSPAPSTWRFFGGGGQAAGEAKRGGGVAEATRAGRAIRSHRTKVKPESSARRSLWKWS